MRRLLGFAIAALASSLIVSSPTKAVTIDSNTALSASFNLSEAATIDGFFIATGTWFCFTCDGSGGTVLPNEASIRWRVGTTPLGAEFFESTYINTTGGQQDQFVNASVQEFFGLSSDPGQFPAGVETLFVSAFFVDEIFDIDAISLGIDVIDEERDFVVGSISGVVVPLPAPAFLMLAALGVFAVSRKSRSVS
ncbi:MAG: hypothetical protein AAGC81_11790 [Pseudomonadota bacterium]